MARTNKNQPALFTIGHSNHSLEVFVSLLKQHSIQALVDVRSSPYSKYSAHFNREDLHNSLTQVGIKYVFMGKELGGRPKDEQFYDEKGHVLYHKLAEASFFKEGIERLEKGISQYRVAIMCSEEDPEVCHRHLLVGRVMRERRWPILHIRGDGKTQSDSQLRESGTNEQFLFDSFADNPWKSLKPIGRSKASEPSTPSESTCP